MIANQPEMVGSRTKKPFMVLWPSWSALSRHLLISAIISAPLVAMAQPGGGPAVVRVSEVERGRVYEEVRLSGNIEPVRASMVAAAISGEVDEVLVDTGDIVSEGQPLVRLRGEAVQRRVAVARAVLEEEAALLEELLAGTREEDLAIAKAEVRTARASLRLAEAEIERSRELLAENVISRAEFDRIEAEQEAATAELERRRALLRRAEAGPRPEPIDAARARVDAARAEHELYLIELDRHTIRAPFESVIGSKQTERGQWVTPGTVVFGLAQLDPIRAEFSLPERYFNRMTGEIEVEITLDSVPGQTFRPTLDRLVPLADFSSRSFPVRFELDNAERLIAPGMMARASVLFPQESDGFLVPRDAVVMNPDRSRSVWVIEQDGDDMTAQRREVEVGANFRGRLQVVNGVLAEGDRVIVRGNESLRPGQAVRLEGSDAPPPEAAEMAHGQPASNDEGADGTPAGNSNY